MFILQRTPIDIKSLCQHSDNQSGALVTFEGLVRADQHQQQKVATLHYFADEPLCRQKGQIIIQEAKNQYRLNHALCVQRFGPIQVGEAAIWIGAWGSHRDETFQGCRYIIEEVKKHLHIWKKEILEDGTTIWKHGKETINL